MPRIGTGINVLRSLVFVRNFGNKILEKTDIRVRSNTGNLQYTAIDTQINPKKISFRARNNLITVQKDKSQHDRFIDILA